MTEKCYIGVDVGTGSARAGVFDETGKMRSTAQHPIEMNRPQIDFVEQSSEEYLAHGLSECPGTPCPMRGWIKSTSGEWDRRHLFPGGAGRRGCTRERVAHRRFPDGTSSSGWITGAHLGNRRDQQHGTSPCCGTWGDHLPGDADAEAVVVSSETSRTPGSAPYDSSICRTISPTGPQASTRAPCAAPCASGTYLGHEDRWGRRLLLPGGAGGSGR